MDGADKELWNPKPKKEKDGIIEEKTWVSHPDGSKGDLRGMERKAVVEKDDGYLQFGRIDAECYDCRALQWME